MTRIDFLARKQIVQRSDSVPRTPSSKEFANEKLLISSVQMLANSDSRSSFRINVTVLQSLALANRIKDQANIALSRQTLCERLIRVDRLAGVRMATASYDARHWLLTVFGNIQIGRDKKIRSTLEN